MVSAVSRSYWTMMLFASSSTWNAISSIVSSAYSPPSSVCSFLKHSRITLARPVKLSLSMYNSTSRDGETQARVSFRTSKSIRSMPTLTNGNQQKLKSKKRKLNRNLSTEKIVIEAFENEKEVDDQGSSLMIPSEIKNDESSLQSKYLKHLDRHLVLVLNADYQPLSHAPLSLWTWQDAVKAIFSGKVTVVDTYHDPNLLIRAVNVNFPLPSVIAFRDYSPRSCFRGKAKNQNRRPAFTRKNVYLRDEYRCQYCSNMFPIAELSIDHVVPRCRGGVLCWENAVTCCRDCNGKKGCLLPSEMHQVGLKLIRDPKCPTAYELSLVALKLAKRRDIHPAWEPYLM